MTDMELEIPTVSTGSDTVPVQQASMEVSSSNAHEAAIPIQSTIAPPIVSIDASTTEGTPSGSPPPIATTSSSSYQIDGHSVRVFGAAPIAQTSTTPKDDQGSPSSSVREFHPSRALSSHLSLWELRRRIEGYVRTVD